MVLADTSRRSARMKSLIAVDLPYGRTLKRRIMHIKLNFVCGMTHDCFCYESEVQKTCRLSVRRLLKIGMCSIVRNYFKFGCYKMG